MPRAAISLGANLGERFVTLGDAVRSLHRPTADLQILAISSWYRTDAVGPPQPDYINGCLTLQTTLTPQRLLDELQGREAHWHRERTVHWGPRTLDLDLLLYDGWQLKDPHLELPHPRLAERPFVLVPLAEIAPDWLHPVHCRPIAELCAERGSAGVQLCLDRAMVVTGLGPVEIRPLERVDFALLTALAARCWAHTYRGLLSENYIKSFVSRAYSIQSLTHHYERADSSFWVAVDGQGRLVGFAQTTVSGESALLVRLYVAPECQGRGLGSALWNHARRKLDYAGVRLCTLTVLQTNAQAIGFYERLGFSRVGPVDGDRYEYQLVLER
jgi:2-amino-4-hydroxy-6-hydroxymethyldihydropteridine diphosphokinase